MKKKISGTQRTMTMKTTKNQIDYFEKFYKPNGILKDKKDTRDYFLSVSAESAYPTFFRSDSWGKLEVKNQGRLGSCAGQSGDTAMEDIKGRETNDYSYDFSPMWLYYRTREISGMQDRDAGCYLRDICKVLQTQGISLEMLWPYDVNKVFINPSIISNVFARLFRIDSYYRCYNIVDIKEALTSGYSVIGGWEIFSSFYDAAGTGKVPMPISTDISRGGHAMWIGGWDDNRQELAIQNSWGKTFGDEGRVYIPYEYTVKYAYDIWALRPKGSNPAKSALIKALRLWR